MRSHLKQSQKSCVDKALLEPAAGSEFVQSEDSVITQVQI